MSVAHEQQYESTVTDVVEVDVHEGRPGSGRVERGYLAVGTDQYGTIIGEAVRMPGSPRTGPMQPSDVEFTHRRFRVEHLDLPRIAREGLALQKDVSGIESRIPAEEATRALQDLKVAGPERLAESAKLDGLAQVRLGMPNDHSVEVKQAVPVEVTSRGRGGPERLRGHLGVGLDTSTGSPVLGLVDEHQVVVGQGTSAARSEPRYTMVTGQQVGLDASSPREMEDVAERLGDIAAEGIEIDGAGTRSQQISSEEVQRALQELRIPSNVPYGVELPTLHEHYGVGAKLEAIEADRRQFDAGMRQHYEAEQAREEREAAAMERALETEPELAHYMELTDDLGAARRMLQEEERYAQPESWLEDRAEDYVSLVAEEPEAEEIEHEPYRPIADLQLGDAVLVLGPDEDRGVGIVVERGDGHLMVEDLDDVLTHGAASEPDIFRVGTAGRFAYAESMEDERTILSGTTDSGAPTPGMARMLEKARFEPSADGKLAIAHRDASAQRAHEARDDQDPRAGWCKQEHEVQDGIDRIREAVDGWNPASPTMAPRIEKATTWIAASQERFDALQGSGRIEEVRAYYEGSGPGSEGAGELRSLREDVRRASAAAGVKEPDAHLRAAHQMLVQRAASREEMSIRSQAPEAQAGHEVGA